MQAMLALESFKNKATGSKVEHSGQGSKWCGWCLKRTEHKILQSTTMRSVTTFECFGCQGSSVLCSTLDCEGMSRRWILGVAGEDAFDYHEGACLKCQGCFLAWCLVCAQAIWFIFRDNWSLGQSWTPIFQGLVLLVLEKWNTLDVSEKHIHARCVQLRSMFLKNSSLPKMFRYRFRERPRWMGRWALLGLWRLYSKLVFFFIWSHGP